MLLSREETSDSHRRLLLSISKRMRILLSRNLVLLNNVVLCSVSLNVNLAPLFSLLRHTIALPPSIAAPLVTLTVPALKAKTTVLSCIDSSASIAVNPNLSFAVNPRSNFSNRLIMRGAVDQTYGGSMTWPVRYHMIGLLFCSTVINYSRSRKHLRGRSCHYARDGVGQGLVWSGFFRLSHWVCTPANCRRRGRGSLERW